ncbi:MAG: glycosyl hydrolase [Ginsengibacter sp.]
MNKAKFVSILFIIFLFGTLIPLIVAAQPSERNAGDGNFKSLKEGFLSPGKEYGSAPLWVWHTKVTKEIIDSMMAEFKQNEFGGVMIHPRPGLITEYLSPEWFSLYQYTVKKGKELGLDVWIYDENSYPSGFAGGNVPDQMPESYNQGQMLHLIKADVLPADPKDIFIALKEDNGNFTDITSHLMQEKNKTGNFYLFQKAFYQKQANTVGPPEFSYVDLMAKGVTEKFIEITLKGYEKIVGNEFGKTIPGVFSDEPSIPTQGAGNIRWTPDLFSSFKKKWGYDLQTHLPSLFEEVGDWKKIRHNYQQTLLQLFIDRWSKPMHAYAEKNNLKWTGHYWEHGWPNPGEGPDNMAMYAWHQQPGIDMLFNQFNETSPNAQFGNIRSVKELASVANQLNKKRTLSETYGGGGWELTFKDMKRLADWEYVLGVNFLNQHLSMMTLTGARKYDYPQSFSYHTPWWPYYKSLNEYFKRLSFAMSQGKQMNDILIIEPTSSAWMYSGPGKQNEGLTSIGNRFQQFVTTLEKSQVEYDLGSENIIKDHGSVKGRNFVVGERSYHTVVIPPGMENIDEATYELLRAYAEAGGKVLFFQKLQRIDGSLRNELQYFNNSKKNILQFVNLDQSIIEQQFRSDDFQIMANGTDSIGGDLYHHRRWINDGQILFLSNAGVVSPSKGHVTIKGKDALLMNLATGAIEDYPEQVRGDKIVVNFNIPPAGSLMLFVANKKQQGVQMYPSLKNKSIIKGSDTKVVRPVENTLMIDFCDVQLNDTLLKDTHVGVASRAVFMHNGFSRNPWNHQVQFKDHIIARDTFSKGSGYTAIYHFVIDEHTNYKQFRAVVEQGNLWNQITINGKPVKPVAGKWWLDRSFAVLQISEYLNPGENTLSLTIDPMSVYAEVEPVYILGDFNLASADKGWKIVSPQPLQLGSWKDQGLPLYGSGIRYIKKFDLKNPDHQFEMHLDQWRGTVAAIKVNGVPAGIIYSEPNTLNISRHVKKGINEIEVEVIGSLKNLLGPHHNSPQPGMVGPGHWSNIKSYPPGKDYDTYDYGLMTDFELFMYDN